MPEAVIGTETRWSITGTDVETTGLTPGYHEVWEWAGVHRFRNTRLNDTSQVIQIRPLHMDRFEDEAREVNHFDERFLVPEGAEAATVLGDGSVYPITRDEALQAIRSALAGTILVGSNTQFDNAHLMALLGEQPWHYRPINVIELAVGALLASGQKIELPWNSVEISRMVGVEPPEKDKAHSALPDALWALRVLDAINPDGLLRVK